MRRALIGAAGLLIPAAIGTCCAVKATGVRPAAPAVAVPPPSAAPTGPVSELFGINEAISIPERTLRRDKPRPPAVRAMLAADARAVVDLGGRWVRAHTAVLPSLYWRKYARNPEQAIAGMDLWMRVVQAAGLSPLVMISPFPGNHTSSATPAYVIDDHESYAAYVTAVVERYDGDGIDDMPGLLAPVHAWEIDNEPDLKNTARPRDAARDFDPSTFCTPEQYAAVLIETAALIRAADDRAVVLNGGFYRPMTDTAYRYMSALFAVPGALESIDVLSLHVYHSGRDMARMERAVATGRELAPGKPIWITETNVPSVPASRSEPWVSERYQAEMVVRTYVTALRLGVEKVFWHTLNDPPPDHEGRSGPNMSNHSLYRATEADGALELKPAGRAYAALTEALAGVDWSQVQDVPIEGGELLRAGDRWILIGTSGQPVTVELPAVEVSELISGISVGVLDGEGLKTLDPSGGPLLLRAL